MGQHSITAKIYGNLQNRAEEEGTTGKELFIRLAQEVGKTRPQALALWTQQEPVPQFVTDYLYPDGRPGISEVSGKTGCRGMSPPRTGGHRQTHGRHPGMRA